ncbi:alpha/beta hydrolase-fold protein [Soonwooa sp.]|uniref:alpha/beta hydrolase n=1 Tax=Soonwooa sp. TaxID=1938592 RepID=UPI0026388CB6|nr:alpha/beta hydrolase-fold protein [Soonwooa sp.]
MNISKTLSTLIICFFLALNFSTTKAQSEDTIPQHDSLRIDSKILNESRLINIWIPEEYRNSSKTLPVLYMPDGGLKEDFPHVANTLAQLISDKKVPAYILVGIENTQRRRDLTPPTQVKEDKEIAPVVGGAANFQKFIETELFPIINKTYKTNNKKAIIGESLAGLFIIESLLKKPAMFDAYIAIDPSLWWNNESLIKNSNKLLKQLKSTKKLWIAASSDMIPTVTKFDKQVKASKTKIKYHYVEAPKEDHSTIYKAVEAQALIWALN